MLLFNSLPTDLEDKAYSNLTIPSILGYSSFVTSSHYLPSQTLFFGAWVSLHKNPCLRRQLLWEKTTRCTWKTYDSRPLLLIRVDDGSTVEFRGTKMFSLWRRDHSAMPINHQLRRGTNPFDVLLWHIKHASKHGLVLSWIQNTAWLSNGETATPIQPSCYSQNPELHIEFPLVSGSSVHEWQWKSIVCQGIQQVPDATVWQKLSPKRKQKPW